MWQLVFRDGDAGAVDNCRFQFAPRLESCGLRCQVKFGKPGRLARGACCILPVRIVAAGWFVAHDSTFPFMS